MSDPLHRARRAALIARLMIAVTVAWTVVFGAYTFQAAFHATGPLGATLDLAIAAFDFTLAISTSLRWPRWPKPDPRTPPP